MIESRQTSKSPELETQDPALETQDPAKAEPSLDAEQGIGNDDAVRIVIALASMGPICL
jgi:hypothetical protein